MVETNANASEKVIEKLVGCTLVLDPKRSGMFVDNSNKVNLHFFSDGNDRFVFVKNMDPTSILRNVKAGILRVEKEGKDISTDFDGPPVEAADWRRKPIVENVPSRADLKGSDRPLIQILGRNKESEIIRDVNSINDYKVLSRLEELEKMGNNPVAVGRVAILDALKRKMKTVSGISEPGKLSEKEEVISAK
jgi:hypothetical protein